MFSINEVPVTAHGLLRVAPLLVRHQPLQAAVGPVARLPVPAPGVAVGPLLHPAVPAHPHHHVQGPVAAAGVVLVEFLAVRSGGGCIL